MKFHNPAVEGTYKEVPFVVLDLNKLSSDGFIPGFYYSVGTDEGEPIEEPEVETTVIIGPYATKELAESAAAAFIETTL